MSGWMMEEKVRSPIPRNENPTAKASMLVATASVSNTTGDEGLSIGLFSFLPFLLSHIILPPMNVRSAKANQWSYTSICLLKRSAVNHPTKGIKA